MPLMGSANAKIAGKAVPSSQAVPGNKVDLESQLRARISALSYLPTTAAVAMKFVELGKDPEAGPDQYCKVVSSDPSLSSNQTASAGVALYNAKGQPPSLDTLISRADELMYLSKRTGGNRLHAA